MVNVSNVFLLTNIRGWAILYKQQKFKYKSSKMLTFFFKQVQNQNFQLRFLKKATNYFFRYWRNTIFLISCIDFRGARGVMILTHKNGYRDSNSNPRRSNLHIT